MSYLFPFDFEEDRSEVAEIEAHVLVRGGRIVDRGSRVALASLGEWPVILLLDGPKAGTLAKLLHSGIGRLETIWEPTCSELSQAAGEAVPDPHNGGQVYDLAGGEARLREVMHAIRDDIGAQISRDIAREALGHHSAEVNSMPSTSWHLWRDRAECLDGLAPLLEAGRVCDGGDDWVGIVNFLTQDLGDALQERMTANARSPQRVLAPAHLVLATPGLGKTRAIQDLIGVLPSEAVVWVFQPTLRKAEEFAKDMTGSPRQVRVFRGRGAPVENGASECMCPRNTAAEEIAAKGYSVKKLLCGMNEQETGGTCPQVKTCAYQAQIKDLRDHQGGGVFVMTHASLVLPPPCPAPHLVIVDEDPSAGLPQSVTVEAQALGAASDWATHLRDDGEQPPPRKGGPCEEDEVPEPEEEEPEFVLTTFERLRESLAGHAPLREIATSVTITELEAALKLLRGLERKLSAVPKPGMRDAILRDLLAVSALPEIQAVQAILFAILQEVRLAVDGVIDRPDFNGLTICRGQDGSVRSVTAHRLARTGIKSSVPMIVLDGTADPVLMGRALRRQMIIWRIDLKRQGEVVQCVGRGFSNTSLAPSADYPTPAAALAERDQLWHGLAAVLRREAAAAPKGVLVVSTLAVEIEARRRHCSDDLLVAGMDWTHFGATRGINAFTDRQTVVVIGRKQPPTGAVQTLARAYFALDPQPFDPGAADYVVRRKTLFGKSGQMGSTTLQVHPDPRANRILWQLREAEVIQALDRVRAARFPRRIVILNSLDLRRPDDDLRNPDLGLPADLHLSWPELRNGGNRAETILATSGGFLPVAPKALTLIAPEIFSGIEAAKKWLHRTDLEKALACHSEHLIRIQVRPAGQRGAPWPLIVDRRQHACSIVARAAFEALLGAEMAVWKMGGSSDVL